MNILDFTSAPYGNFVFYTGTYITITVMTSDGGAVQVKHAGSNDGVSSVYLPRVPYAARLSYITDGNFVGISEQILPEGTELDTSDTDKILVVSRHSSTNVFPADCSIDLPPTSVVRLSTATVPRVLRISGYGTYKVSTDLYSYTANTETYAYVAETNMNLEYTSSSLSTTYFSLLSALPFTHGSTAGLPLLIV